jgi:formate hydrogenlyase transcriptional activator
VIVATSAGLTIELPQSPRLKATPRSEPRSLDEMDRDHIRNVLERTGWRVQGERGAAVLKLKPTTLEARMTKLGLRRPMK